MKVSKKIGDTTVHAEGDNVRELFKELSELEEIFSIQQCGRCKGDVRHVHRVVEENDFFEVRCKDWDCGARLQFGCKKKGGGLFPGKQNKEGKTERKWQTMDEIMGEKE